MSIKFKHCCLLNHKDYIEAETVNIQHYESFTDVVKISVYDATIDTEIDLYLDKKTAIRFAKTVRTEINKIQD